MIKGFLPVPKDFSPKVKVSEMLCLCPQETSLCIAVRNTTTVFGATSRGPHSINPRVDAVVRSQNAYQRFSDDEEENYETTQREGSPLKRHRHSCATFRKYRRF